MIHLLLPLSAAFLPITFEDPKGVLAQTDAFFGVVPFEFAYQVGDKMDAQKMLCTFDCQVEGCEENCTSRRVESQVMARSVEKVTIRTSIGGATAETREFSKESYSAASGNPVRLFFQGTEKSALPAVAGFASYIGPNDYVVIESMAPQPTRLSGGQEVLEAIRVQMTLYSWLDDYKQFLPQPFYLVAGKSIPGLAQILALGTQDESVGADFSVLSYSPERSRSGSGP